MLHLYAASNTLLGLRDCDTSMAPAARSPPVSRRRRSGC